MGLRRRPGGGALSERVERGSKKRIARWDRAEWGSRDMWIVVGIVAGTVAIYLLLVWCQCV